MAVTWPEGRAAPAAAFADFPPEFFDLRTRLIALPAQQPSEFSSMLTEYLAPAGGPPRNYSAQFGAIRRNSAQFGAIL